MVERRSAVVVKRQMDCRPEREVDVETRATAGSKSGLRER